MLAISWSTPVRDWTTVTVSPSAPDSVTLSTGGAGGVPIASTGCPGTAMVT